MPLQESGQLNLIEGDSARITTPLGFDAFVVNGHTDAQMCPILDHGGQPLVYMADLLPSTGHIPLPYVMGYDTRPLLTLEEKARILNEAASRATELLTENRDKLDTLASELENREMLDEDEVVEVIGPAVPRTFENLSDDASHGNPAD